MNKDKVSDSRLIEFLRFPLTCAVVCIHCNITASCQWLQDDCVFSSFSYVFINVFCCIANPVFFFFSGFLFFKEGEFSTALYRRKIQQRVRTLLIPYISWIIIYFAVVAVLQSVNQNFMLLLHKSIKNFALSDYFYLFWNIQKITNLPTTQAAPLVIQFWYLQCLMMCALFSPVIWWGVKRLSIVFVVLLGAVSMFELLPEWPGIIWYAFFYFSLGAYFSASNLSITRFTEQYGAVFYLLLVVSIVASFFTPLTMFMLNVGLLFVVLDISIRIIRRKVTMPAMLTSGSFFIFCVHRLVTAVMTNLPKYGLVPLQSTASAFLYYFLSVTVSVLVCVAVYLFVHRYFPKTTAFLSGGRSSR